jgi:hypothetical protein
MRKSYLFFAGLLIISPLAQAQNADSIINKYLSAIGGREKIAQIKTLHIESVIDQGGIKIPIVLNGIHQKAFKQEVTFGGMTGYDITTDTAGWYFSPFNGMTQPDSKTPDRLKIDITNLDLQGPLFNYKDKGYEAKFIEKDDVDGVECLVVLLLMKNNMEKKYYFDPSSYFLIKESTKTEVDGQEQNNAVIYSNYQKTDIGIIRPLTEDSFGQINVIEKVVTNGPMDPSIFKRSAK